MVPNEIVDMVAMRDSGMSAARAVHVVRFVSGTRMSLRACIGQAVTDGEFVLVDMVVVGIVQMAVMEVTHMLFVAYCLVTTARAMLVIMVCVRCVVAFSHGFLQKENRNGMRHRHIATVPRVQ